MLHTTIQYTHKRATISSFSIWLQAWNIYLTVILTYNPTQALELVGYQHIITSTDHSLSLKARLQYDRQFCTLAASNPPSIGTDATQSCGMKPWPLQITLTKTKEWWPCPYHVAKNHFPENFLSFALS